MSSITPAVGPGLLAQHCLTRKGKIYCSSCLNWSFRQAVNHKLLPVEFQFDRFFLHCLPTWDLIYLGLLPGLVEAELEHKKLTAMQSVSCLLFCAASPQFLHFYTSVSLAACSQTWYWLGPTTCHGLPCDWECGDLGGCHLPVLCQVWKVLQTYSFTRF